MPKITRPIDLKPCPFCGGEVNIVLKDNGLFESGHYFLIKHKRNKCNVDCVIFKYNAHTLEDACKTWNRRSNE